MERIPAYEGTNRYLFVSYAHKDAQSVLPVIENLYRNHYRLWYDEGITPGSEWPHNIASHLERADTVLVFSSASSIASINCENEVVRARELNRNIIVYTLDDMVHSGLDAYPHVHDLSGLEEHLDPNLIGDGTEGYEHSSQKSRRAFLWDMVSGLAAVAGIAMIAGLYGIGAGWFDRFLPARTPAEVPVQETPEPTAESINNSLVAQAVLSNLGRDELMKKVDLPEEEYLDFCQMLGFDYETRNLTYYDLTNDFREELYVMNVTDQELELLKYFPSLKRLSLDQGRISSLAPLQDCSNLETVELYYDLLPVEFPDGISYEIWIR
ncbi:MAG: toll/interleukin-1 receptor domain-containing protein [Solobacterium sp.]|nr:toll/interleukin-1 receptor domain-containing protein [Solobacterium sp.]